MQKVIQLFCALIVLAVSASGQSSKVNSLKVIPTGEEFGIFLNSPAGLLADQTFTLPSAGGTLLVSPSSGVSTAWLLGGNDVSSTPLLNQIGTTTPQDLQLVAGGASNVRLTLDDATAAVTVNNGGELRLEETGGTNYSAFKAGTQSADITYTLPITAPTTGQVLQAGATPTNLEWATVVSPVPAYNITTANVTSNSAAWSNGVSVAVAANKTYLVEVRATFVPTSDANPDSQFRFAIPSGTIIGGYSTATAVSGDAIAAYTSDATVAVTLPANGTFSLSENEEHTLFFSGTLTVGGTAGNVALEFSNMDGTGSTVLRAGAFIKVTPL